MIEFLIERCLVVGGKCAMSVFRDFEKAFPVVGQFRPPGTLNEDQLEDLCVSCGDCQSVCPLGAIEMDASGYPVLKDHSKCRLCGLCADICMHGAIELTDRTRVGLKMVKAIESYTNFW